MSPDRIEIPQEILLVEFATYLKSEDPVYCFGKVPASEYALNFSKTLLGRYSPRWDLSPGDLSQQAYLNLLSSAERRPDEVIEYPRTYLGRIVHNALIDHLRRCRSSQEVLQEGHLETGDFSGIEILEGGRDLRREESSEEGPLQELQFLELQESLLQEIGMMDNRKNAEALEAHIIEGRQYAQIAKEKDLPIGKVMSRIYYGRQVLRGRLSRFLPEQD
jgi:RNA polymerase sigma-70 factor (ECF subfamily)